MAVGSTATAPISISGASRLTTLTLSIAYNPAILRVRSVTEGAFMRQGGITPSFTQQVDPAGRVDIVITRPGDQVGAVGTGTVAGLVFEAVAPGTATLSVSGVGNLVGGGMAALSFGPTTVVVK
jgi:general secretion pathway protein D